MLRQSAAAAPAAPGPALQAARGSSGVAREQHRCWDIVSEVDYFLEESLLCRKAPRKSSGRHKLVLWAVGGLCSVQRGRSQEQLCACPDPPQSCAYEGLKSDPGGAELLPGLVDVSGTVEGSVPEPLIGCRALRTPAGHRKGAGAESCLRHCGTAGAQGPLPPCSLEEEMSETMKSCGSRRSSSAGELQGSHRTILKELQETRQVLHLLTVLQAGGVRATRALGTHHPVPEASYHGMKLPSLLQETS